jgi:hypothetical protein
MRGGVWSCMVDFMCLEAFALMTERAVSAIDKRTDSEINRQLRLAGIHFKVDHFTLCFINGRGAEGDVQSTHPKIYHKESIMQRRKN